tara:strand:- start:2199 stop:2372 length:174 start_codon:yes stop_codon:yes gene_type:complete
LVLGRERDAGTIISLFCQDEHGKQAGFANRQAVPYEPQTLQFNLDGFACRLPAIQWA